MHFQSSHGFLLSNNPIGTILKATFKSTASCINTEIITEPTRNLLVSILSLKFFARYVPLCNVLLLDSIKFHSGQVNRDIGELIKLAGLDAYGLAKFCMPLSCDFRRFMDMPMERKLWLIVLQKVVNRL